MANTTSLKRKICPDCDRDQGSLQQWLNNNKLCAAHTMALDARLDCLQREVTLLKSEARGLRQANVSLRLFAKRVAVQLKDIESLMRNEPTER